MAARIRKASLKRLKELEGESFRFIRNGLYINGQGDRAAGCFDVIRIDLFKPDEFLRIPFMYRDKCFLGIVYRSRRDGACYLSLLGRHLVGPVIKEVTATEIQALESNPTGYTQQLAHFAKTDPVSLLRWY